MKDVILILSLLLTFICYSCKSDDEPSLANEGSMRDWKYPAANVKVYKDGEIQSSVTEITVRSLQLSSGEEAIYNPQYDTTLKIKGLQKKNKITHVRVHSTIDDFTGATTLNSANTM